MSPARAHARIEAGQPWYSVGLICLSLGLLAHLFAPALPIGAIDVRDVAVGFLVGIGLSMLIMSVWKQARAGGDRAP